MKKLKQKPCSDSKLTLNKTSTFLLGTMACAVVLPMTVASVRADDAPSRFNGLFNVDFANEYVTPRGMMVRDQGLTVQPLILGFFNVYKGDSFINSVTLDGGMWNDIGTKSVGISGGYNSKPGTQWTEIDPIGGFSVGFAKYFTLDVTATAFVEQIESIGTSTHLDNKLSFNDSPLLPLGGFGFHPYFEFWQELSGKATDADLPEELLGPSRSSGKYAAPGSSYYFETGVDPSYTFKDGIKVETPVDVLLPSDRFYGQYYGSSSTVGLFDLGVKGTMPMNFMPQGYGHWSCHAGVKFMDFVDDNLYHLNAFNSPGKPTRTTTLFYAGVSVFF